MKKVEEMTIDEMKEFAVKVSLTIPPELKTRKEILKFLKDPTKQGPSEKNIASKELQRLGEVETQKKSRAESEKILAKIPLTEPDKAYLAELEKLARSGRSPNIDQMRDLRILRMRKTITPLSTVEQRELDELEVKAQGGPVEVTNKSGLPDEDRLTELRKRSKLE